MKLTFTSLRCHPPGPAETEHLCGHLPDLRPRSQVDLAISAIDVPLPPRLKSFLNRWQREDLSVRVCQGVQEGLLRSGFAAARPLTWKQGY